MMNRRQLLLPASAGSVRVFVETLDQGSDFAYGSGTRPSPSAVSSLTFPFKLGHNIRVNLRDATRRNSGWASALTSTVSTT